MKSEPEPAKSGLELLAPPMMAGLAPAFWQQEQATVKAAPPPACCSSPEQKTSPLSRYQLTPDWDIEEYDDNDDKVAAAAADTDNKKAVDTLAGDESTDATDRNGRTDSPVYHRKNNIDSEERRVAAARPQLLVL